MLYVALFRFAALLFNYPKNVAMKACRGIGARALKACRRACGQYVNSKHSGKTNSL